MPTFLACQWPLENMEIEILSDRHNVSEEHLQSAKIKLANCREWLADILRGQKSKSSRKTKGQANRENVKMWKCVQQVLLGGKGDSTIQIEQVYKQGCHTHTY